MEDRETDGNGDDRQPVAHRHVAKRHRALEEWLPRADDAWTLQAAADARSAAVEIGGGGSDES
jgi:hypothetical protein